MFRRADVVALFVDPRGPYPNLVEQWFDEARDGRTYTGDLPVVVHPPCGPWGKLKHLSKKDDPSHALFAVELVRRVGGVLEHPAGSLLWEAAGMPRPGELPDAFGGVSLEVCQVDFGHPARKRTWLYFVGVRDVGELPPPREPTHWISGFRSSTHKNIYARSGSAVPENIKICSAQQRRRTPEAFARWLLDVAASARARPRDNLSDVPF